MTDPSQPLSWPHGDADSPAASATGPASGFLWPSPPYAAYPQPQVQRGAEACEILGLNNSRSMGQLLQFDASDRMVQINVPPARNSMPLKFSQFRAIKLLRSLPVPPRDAADLNSPLSVDQRPRSDFRIVFNGGDELKGVTIGHHHDNFGLFLFPPLADDDDSVRRVFVPREVLAHFEIGERLGDMLLKDALVTPEQLNAAAIEQSDLRQRRVGDILVNQQIVTYFHDRFGPKLMSTPLDENVTGYAQQVGLRIAHVAQVSCAQQSQIGLLGQVFDIHRRAHAPPEETQKAPIPALLPPREHRTIRHATSDPLRIS